MDYYREAVNIQENERAWVTYIKAKVMEQNQSFPTLVVGQTGSGKSWSTLRLCEEIDPDFQLDGNWYFRANEFFKDYSKFYKETPKRAKIWVLDEAGVDFSSDAWQSKINKIFAQVFSTARFRNYIFFGTVPFIGFISKKIRQLMQYRMTANYLHNDGKSIRSILVPRCLQWSDSKDDFYYHKLIKIDPTGGEDTINRILLPKPSKRLREEYEKQRAEFSNDLNAELLEQMGELTQNAAPINPQYQTIIDGIKEGKKPQEIAEILNLSTHTINNTIRRLKKKGWCFVHNKVGNRIYNPFDKKWTLYPKEERTKNLNTS